MYSSADFVNYTQRWIGEKLAPEHLALMRHLTVRLHAAALGRGAASSSFTGTGVVVRVDGDRTHVVTAKHNLHVAGRGAKVEVERYVATFEEKVRVELTTPAGAQVWGSIRDVQLVDDNIANQGYDVMVLRIEDAAFAATVRGVASPNGQPNRFTAQEWRDGGPTILQLRDAYGARSVVMNGQAYTGPPQVKDDANWNLLQFGYGRVSETGNFAFGCRALPFAKLKNALFIDETHDHFQDVFVFDTTDQLTTTFEGDSGGPAFAVDRAGAQSFVAGVTLGANYFPDRTDNDGPTVNNAFTVLSSDRVHEYR